MEILFFCLSNKAKNKRNVEETLVQTASIQDIWLSKNGWQQITIAEKLLVEIKFPSHIIQCVFVSVDFS